MLIDSSGEKVGLVEIDVAKNLAEKDGLDLVQVSPPDSNPVVCKILNYGKHVFEKKKSSGSSNAKTKNTVKEIKFRPSTDVADYNVKLKRLKALFLEEIRLK